MPIQTLLITLASPSSLKKQKTKLQNKQTKTEEREKNTLGENK